MSEGYVVALNSGTDLNEGHCVVMHSIVKRTYESVRGKVYSKMFYNIMDPATGTYKSISKNAIHNSNIIIHWR